MTIQKNIHRMPVERAIFQSKNFSFDESCQVAGVSALALPNYNRFGSDE
jgi:hypothetical protein